MVHHQALTGIDPDPDLDLLLCACLELQLSGPLSREGSKTEQEWSG
jgi:hypothetical protein